jgi:hypothetical protein
MRARIIRCMPIGTKSISLIASLSVMVPPSFARAVPAAPTTPSIVRLNVVCATCHEGECSGRQTFQLAPEASDGYIRRYAGDITTQPARLIALEIEPAR